MTPSPAPAPTEAPQTIAAAFARAKELWLNDSSDRTLDQHEDDQLQALLQRREAQARRDGAEVEREAIIERLKRIHKMVLGYDHGTHPVAEMCIDEIRARSNPSGDRT